MVDPRILKAAHHDPIVHKLLVMHLAGSMTHEQFLVEAMVALSDDVARLTQLLTDAFSRRVDYGVILKG